MDNKIRFCCLSSGSDSNCFYLGTNDNGILIDAGLGIRETTRRLAEKGISVNSIKAIFITHNHIDHVRASASLGERKSIPIYATEETIKGINYRNCITPKLDSCVHYITKNNTTKVGDFEITAFEVPHDAEDCVGYCISIYGRVFSFLTDLGHISPTAAEYILRSNYLIIEANHDPELLYRNPRYPSDLKDRIRGQYGHLSNQQTADFIANNLTDTTSHIWLCHLSLENNRPELAYHCVAEAVRRSGKSLGNEVFLEVLRNGEMSDLYEFNPLM